MTNWRVVASLSITYIMFAILLNSVGTVILQVINSYGVSKTEASILEGLKDIPIAVVGFLVASFAPRIGYKNSILIGLVAVCIVCVFMPLYPSFLNTQILFFVVGCSFGLIKVSIYSSIGLVTQGPKEHASLTNIIEGIFMVGVLIGYWLFSIFINPDDLTSTSWLNVYWPILAIGIVSIIATMMMSLDESQAIRNEGADKGSPAKDFLDMILLAKEQMVYIFMLSAFIYVLIEQGIGSWLPTFNNEVFNLPTDMSVQFASIYAAALALGRFGVGMILKRINWYPVINLCVIAAGVLIVVVIPVTEDISLPEKMGWGNAPLAVFMLPMIGLVLAPIYPAINSCVLSALPKYQHASMTGLIVISSALGGTTGSIVMGAVFEDRGGTEAFLLLLWPIGFILLMLFLFKRSIDQRLAVK